MNADPDFVAYLNHLAVTDAPTNAAEHLAYLLNAYNATCVRVVSLAVAREELSGAGASIRSLGSMWTPIWKKHVGVLGGEEVSLDGIEHGRVRSVFKDARVHACLNCASVSCPDLPRRAFEARTLDKEMDERVALWLGNPTKGVTVVTSEDGHDGGATAAKPRPGEIDTTVVRLSMIFKWYEADFVRESGSVLEWLKEHGAPGLNCLGLFVTVEHADYDWGLNSPPTQPSN